MAERRRQIWLLLACRMGLEMVREMASQTGQKAQNQDQAKQRLLRDLDPNFKLPKDVHKDPMACTAILLVDVFIF